MGELGERTLKGWRQTISSNSRTEGDRRAEYAQKLQLLGTYMY